MSNPGPNNKASFSDLTIGEVLAGLRRYQPFIAAVAAVVLLVTFVPGKPKPSSAQSLGTVNSLPGSNSSVTGPGGVASAPPGSVGVTPGGVGAPQPGAGNVGGGATGPGTTFTGGTGPVATTDPFCDRATGRAKIPSLYAPSCVPP